MSPCNCLFYFSFLVFKLIVVQLYYYTGPPGHSSTGGWPRSHSPLGAKAFPYQTLCTTCGDLAWDIPLYLLYRLPHRGLSRHTQCLWAGNCCLRHPFSSVLEPHQGGDICYSGWVNLAPRNYSSNNVLLAVQAWGTPSARRHVLRPPIRWFSRSVGSYPSFASIFPAHYCPLHGFVSLLRAITLNQNNY